MKKKLAVLSFAAFLAAGSLTACGGSKEAQTTAAQTEAQTEAETAEQETETEAEAAADDRAYEGTTLNVMLAYGGAEKSFDAFTEKTGIKVEYVEISTGKALAQMQAENGNTTADVWFGGGVDSYISASELGYLDQYESPEALRRDHYGISGYLRYPVRNPERNPPGLGRREGLGDLDCHQ